MDRLLKKKRDIEEFNSGSKQNISASKKARPQVTHKYNELFKLWFSLDWK